MRGAERYEVASHRVAVRTVGEPAVTLYWIMMEAHHDDIDGMARLITEQTAIPFRLVACNVNDWDHELSPWPADNITGQDDFTGEAPAFLSWLLWDCVPFVEGWEQPRDPIDRSSHDLEAASMGLTRRVIGGYSMAGLFATWALLKTRAFQGLVSASGSLWYPGWLSWAAKQSTPKECVAYFSLGTKEPRVKNPVVATVGTATEQTEALFAAKSAAHTFVWNPGGHFNEPAKRMASGFAWVLNEMNAERCQ